jgi:hypothetical protein
MAASFMVEQACLCVHTEGAKGVPGEACRQIRLASIKESRSDYFEGGQSGAPCSKGCWHVDIKEAFHLIGVLEPTLVS